MKDNKFTYEKNAANSELCFDWLVYDGDGLCVAAFLSENDAKDYISERNQKYVVHYYWRGDIEDEVSWYFETREEAWDFIKGEIEKRIVSFKDDEETHGKTEIDFDLVKKHLFENGQTEHDDVVYCQCSAWWDNWSLYEMQLTE